VTGFGPFADVAVNASGLVATGLDGAQIEGVRVRGVALPTAFGEARATIARLVGEPGCIGAVAVGVWRGSDVRLERRAHGAVTSARPDVHGEVWDGRELGPELATRVPVDAWAEAVAVWVSEDCGGYVCNATYQALLAACAATVPARPAVFMHVPRDVGERGLAETVAKVRAVVARVVAMAGVSRG